MRKLFLTAFVLAASLVVASTGLALEKTSMRITDDSRGDGWAAGTETCSVQYYNICTGWIWLWGPWAAGDIIGTSFADCGGDCSLDSGYVYFRTVSVAGYGFTGVVSVHASDANECPTGAPLASQPLLPATGWNLVVWGGVPVPDNFTVTYEFHSDQGLPFAMRPATGHPAAGPTGPQACGTCYPSTRATHSYAYGSAASPLCPGSVFADPVCNAELLFDVAMSCTVSIDDQSWGAVKNLYR